MKLVVLFVCAALLTSCRTNKIEAPASVPAAISHSEAETVQVPVNRDSSVAQRYEKVRMDCIQNRRIIAGKIVKVLPDGFVVDSGYADLSRPPLNESWLVPGTVTATRPANLVEANYPDALCVGLVFLTDLPKSRRVIPKLYDYVNIEGYPAGKYIYTSVGDVQRTVRKFTHNLDNATQWQFGQTEKQDSPPK